MVSRPASVNAFEFVVVCALRSRQLLVGCVPRVHGDHNATTMSQMEVAAGQVARMPASESGPRQAAWQRD